MSNSNEKSRQEKPEGGDATTPETGKETKWQIMVDPDNPEHLMSESQKAKARARRALDREEKLLIKREKDILLTGTFMGVIFIIIAAILNSSACTEKYVDFLDWAKWTAVSGVVGFIFGVVSGLLDKNT